MDSTKSYQQPRTPEEKGRPKRARVHRSIYMEQDIYDRLSEAHKMVRHELYPLEVRKSTFIEACISYALNHLSDIKRVLSDNVT
jgi:hypothetical protein